MSNDSEKFDDWFPSYSDLVKRLIGDLYGALGEPFDHNIPWLATTMASTSYRWAKQAQREAWGAGYAKATQDSAKGRLGRAAPDNPYSRPVVPVGGENAAPQDGGSTPPDDGAGPCQRPGCMSRLLDESFGATR